VVIACGTCACTKGIFHDGYHMAGPVDQIVPVDIYIPGCPPKPEAIIDGVVKLLKKVA
jgi:Ni,Fe-hydrogenase III small subunit